MKNSTNFKYLLMLTLSMFAWSSIYAQEKSVSGKVTDLDNEDPLPGVNVLVKGTSTGSITDIEGNYTIRVPDENSVLVFSFIGYLTKEITVGNQTTVNVDLATDTKSLEEVVVVGYGTQKKSQLTGSISSVSSEDIQEVPISDVGQALQGRASGVMALSSGNRPGQGVTIRVRGRRSLTASNDPLYVVDGIPLEGNINDINPQDIESIEVLKDASSTAIYGSRGANGVVLVTTKRGGDHPTIVSYSGYAGFSEVLGMPDIMNAEQFTRMKKISGYQFSTEELDAIERGVSTDWTDLVVQKGFQHNHQFSVRGGDEETKFALSTSYFKEKGVIKTQDFNRATLRLNLDHSVSDRFSVGTSTQISSQKQNWGADVYGQALQIRPLGEAYNEDGSIVHYPAGDHFVVSPLESMVERAYVDERLRDRLFSNTFAVLNILENLNYRLNVGLDIQDYRRGLFQGKDTHASLTRGSDLASKELNKSFTTTLENIVNYSKNYGVHSFNITGLYSLQTSRNESTNVSGSNLPYAHQQFHNIGTAATIESLGSSLEEWGITSYMLRVNYQLKDRYLLTLTGRYDGSSRLSDDHKRGFFPSLALGWNISEEAFMTDQSLFSYLRIRGSYGRTGNTAINPYQTRGGLARASYSFGDNAAFGYTPNSLANPNLQWEVSASANIGLDFGFLEDRIAGSFEVYETHTSGLLLSRNIPITSGYASILQNIGETKNRGFELNITSRNISTSAFSWTTNLNLFANHEEILDLYGTGTDDIGNQWFIGEPLTVWYDYDKLGIWQLNEASNAAEYNLEPGEIKVRDVNGDGRINEQDRVILGSDMPNLNIGISNRLSYSGFDLSIFLFGSFGHTIYNNFEVGNSTMVGRYNNLNVDYWTPENPTNSHPRPDGSVERPIYNTSRGYMSGNFLKVRNIQLGYNVQEKVLSKFGIRSLRVYVNAETPFVFSNLESNLDPEKAGGNITGDSPSTRMYSVGVNFDF